MTLQRNRFATRLFSLAMRVGNALQGLPNRVTPPPFRLVQIGAAFWQSRVLHVAARLDVATRIGDGTLTADEIARQVDADPDALYRMLRMLVAMGIFVQPAPRAFRNNALSDHLRSDNPQSVRAMILMHNSEIMSRPWYEQLEQGVRSGQVPFALTHGSDLFGYMDAHPAFDALFAEAMESVEALAGDSYATDFDWSRFRRVIDVGGSRGGKSVTLLQRHPHLRALVFDRLETIAGARSGWEGRLDPDTLSRLEFHSGDALKALPGANGSDDIYLLSALLHGFADDEAQQVLNNLAAAIGVTGARAVLLEMVMPEQEADLGVAAFDMQMFMGTRGRERTQPEWQALIGRCGLVLEEVVALRSLGSLLVVRATQ